MIGLYIHVPFCRKKCPYCDFYSVGYREDLAERYADAVIRNLRYYDEDYNTVYFGGGTPILIARQIPEILKNCKITPNAEITVECNPLEMDSDTMKRLYDCGVNRISVGMQSASNSELRVLGRTHTFDDVYNAVTNANRAGFLDISADYMLGTPKQDHASLVYGILKLRELPITHVSAYLLKLEPNTAFGHAPPEDLPDEDDTARYYLSFAGMLENDGFKQYEISNFAKAEFQSRHNLKYWRREEYLGIGAAAHSFYKGRRFSVKRDLREFINSEHQTEMTEEENPDETEERIMLGLRLCEGIPRELWRRVESALPLIPKEYYKLENERLSLTPSGFLVSNNIIATLLAHLI